MSEYNLRRRGAANNAQIPDDERVEELSDSYAEADDKEKPVKEKPTAKVRVQVEDDYSPWIDVLRVLSFLVFASVGLSYLVSGGDSYTWGLKHTPKYLQVDYWKSQLKGPIRLTPAELAEYDGRDPEKPLYLAINGTIYDVSSNRRTYGPGGSYQYFAGNDAARAFVTGCFHEDRTADMRGVEDMFLPLDDPETDKHWTAADMAKLKKLELEEAQKKVHDGLAHWCNFFANSPKYQKVGEVVREKNWLDKEPRKKLCVQAAKGRKKRQIPGKGE